MDELVAKTKYHLALGSDISREAMYLELFEAGTYPQRQIDRVFYPMSPTSYLFMLRRKHSTGRDNKAHSRSEKIASAS